MKGTNGYADSFARLIKCPTVSGSGHEYFEAFHGALKEEFPSAFSVLERIDLGSDVLLLKWKGNADSRPVVLMAHQDVVPATGDWTHAPFGAEIEDGVMYGRGTIDCKNTLFCTLQAVEELILEGVVPAQDIYLSYSDCEEISGPGAELARDWFKAHGVTPNVVVDEGGAIVQKLFDSMQKDAAMVGVLEKGYADVKFIAKGKGGHSSQPPKRTPIGQLGRFVAYFDRHEVFKPRMSKAAKLMMRGFADTLKPSTGRLLKMFAGTSLMAHIGAKLSPAGGALYKTTAVFTMCEGAVAPNIIPQQAYVNLNVRFSPVDDPEKCFAKLRKIAKRFDLEMEVVKWREASPMANTDGDGYTYFVNALKEVCPDVAIVPYMIFGGTDCRTLQEISNTAIRCTPCRLTADQLSRMHASDENINLSSIDECVRFFKRFITIYK